MKQFKRRITAATGAILIALGLIGISADRAIAQGNSRKGAKGHSIISPRDAASGLPAGIRVNQKGTTSLKAGSSEVLMETIKRGRRGRLRR